MFVSTRERSREDVKRAHQWHNITQVRHELWMEKWILFATVHNHKKKEIKFEDSSQSLKKYRVQRKFTMMKKKV